jgi:(4S)-4-hydroxy-5-phosphonooxypentane-2,3-dione isomerase
MSRIILSGYIKVSDADLAAVQQALAEHIALTQAEPGCRVFQVEADPSERGRFNVYEEFTDKSAFEAHQTRVQQSTWGRVSQHVQRCYRIESLEDKVIL